jgi:hypothetical protein
MKDEKGEKYVVNFYFVRVKSYNSTIRHVVQFNAIRVCPKPLWHIIKGPGKIKNSHPFQKFYR